MSKAKVFPFLGVGFVLTFTAFLILVAAPFYSYYESSYYYGDYVVNATIFNVSTVFGVFGIIIFILTAIAFIACLANVKYGGSKGPGVFLIVCVIFEILYGLVLFFYSIGLYNYTMTGGIVYIVFSILAHIFSLIAASNFIRLTNYVPSRPVKRATPTSVVGTSSSSSYSSSYSPSGASRVIKFPTETEIDDIYTFEFYGTNVTVRIIDKNTKTVNTQTFFYNTPIACSTTISEDCVFFGFKTKSSSSYSSYSGPFKEVTIKLNNIKTSRVNTVTLVADLERELKRRFTSFTSSGTQASNAANATLNSFESEYGMSFEFFKNSFKSTDCGKKHNSQTNTLYLCKDKKLFFVSEKNQKDPAIILLSNSKSMFRDDEYKVLLASTNVSGIKTYLYNYSDITDIKYFNQITNEMLDQKPAVSKLSKEDDDASMGFSHYVLFFRSNPVKSLYIERKLVSSNSDLESLVNTFKAKKNPTAAEVKASEKNKSQVGALLRKDEPKPDVPASKSSIDLSKEEPVTAKAAPQAPKLEKKQEQKQEPVSSKPGKTKMERIKELKELLDNNLITQEEYNDARDKIIKD